MPRSHAPYPEEFRRRMVELVRSGRTPEELSREFEPSSQAIRNRVCQSGRGPKRRADERWREHCRASATGVTMKATRQDGRRDPGQGNPEPQPGAQERSKPRKRWAGS